MIRLFIGGCRSGKSQHAEAWVEHTAAQRWYIATGEACDPEMQARIAAHQARRKIGWQSIEAPLHLENALRTLATEAPCAILVDCLSTWLGNCLFHNYTDEKILRLFTALCEQIRELPHPIALVTSEVGLSLVPPNPLGRRFRDLAGLLNQQAAHTADSVIVLMAGIPLQIKGK